MISLAIHIIIYHDKENSQNHTIGEISKTTDLPFQFYCSYKAGEQAYQSSQNVPKKKIGAQKLRRTDNSQFQHESTNYILSLLNENRQEEVSPKVLEKYFNIVTSLTVGDAIDFDKLIPSIQGYEFQIVIPEEVINISTSDSNLMILSNGTLVGWNLTEDEIVNYLPVIEGSIESKCETFESEEIDWIELKELPETPLNKGYSYLHGEIMIVRVQIKKNDY